MLSNGLQARVPSGSFHIPAQPVVSAVRTSYVIVSPGLINESAPVVPLSWLKLLSDYWHENIMIQYASRGKIFFFMRQIILSLREMEKQECCPRKKIFI